MFVGDSGGPNLRLNYKFWRKRNINIYITTLCQSAGK